MANVGRLDPVLTKTRARGKNFWKEKAAKSKKMGAKSRNGGRQTRSESSQWEVPGIKLYFETIERPRKEASPMGIKKTSSSDCNFE